MVRIGKMGSGFVADFYMEGLRGVPGATVVANYSRTPERAKLFGAKYGIAKQYTNMDELARDPEVDLVVVGLPNSAHLEGIKAAAKAGKAVVCTKPLARSGAEAAEILRIVKEAGVMHGYAETEVFSPEVIKAKQLIDSGAIGKVLTIRAREAHSGPHAPHFWEAESAGGGALLDMGCHTIEVARYFFGKENRIIEVFGWADTLVHHDKTKGEDNAVLILKLEDGRTATIEASWTAKGGMELRNEVYGTEGRLLTDTTQTRLRAFVQKSPGYIVEKADLDTGWIYPIPDEAHVYGYEEEMRHFVECYAKHEHPREDFVDGYIVNCILDAAYRSIKSGRWERVEIDEGLVQ